MSIHVGFTSLDHLHTNAHFGSAPFVEIYRVDADGYQLKQSIPFPTAKQDGDEDKLTPRIQAVRGCALVYVAAIGGSAAAKLINLKVTPIRAPRPEETIHELLDRLVVMLQGTPPPWLRKSLQTQS